jgi:CO/xanthine dehydrogenase Mo-binding subunit
MTAPAELEVGTLVGAPVARKEDSKLLQGQAQWVDNLYQPGTVFLGIVRSPYAHARINSVNVQPALAHADVIGAWSGSDIEDEWEGSLPCAWLPTEDTKAPEHKPVSVDKVRYVGDAVAVVAATSRAAAEDAMELVEVDYEELPVVVEVEAALAEGAPLVHEELGTNRCYDWKLEAGDVDRLFSEAAVTVTERYRQNRLIPNAIEPARDRERERLLGVDIELRAVATADVGRDHAQLRLGDAGDAAQRDACDVRHLRRRPERELARRRDGRDEHRARLDRVRDQPVLAIALGDRHGGL